MSAPKSLSVGEQAAQEHLHPNDYWNLNAKWNVESGFIAKVLLPQLAADAARDAPPSLDDNGFANYGAQQWTRVDAQLQSYCGGPEKENSAIVEMARHNQFGRESPTSGAVTRMLILFWIAACCELTVFVVQGLFSGGFNPIIVLLAILLAFGGFLTGAGLGKMLHASWSNRVLHESDPVSGAVWAQIVLGCILMLSVAAFRAYGAGEMVPGIFAFLITMLLGALCALFETLHEQAKLKREVCLARQGQAQTWIAYATHVKNLPTYKDMFLSDLRQRSRVGGNITAKPMQADKLVTLVNPVKGEA